MKAELKPENADRVGLWVVSELYYPEETSTGYYMTQIAEGLANDFEVKVICGQPNYSMRGTTAPSCELRRGVEIHRVSGTRLDKNIILFRLVNMLTLGASVLIKAFKSFKAGDRVLVVTTPPNMPFIVALASLFRGASYTLLIHDNYPEILVAVGKTRRDSIFARSVDFCNRWLFKHSARLIVVGRDMEELLRSKSAGLEVPITTIPNWAELETVEPRPKSDNALLGKLGLRDKFVFLYAGNMGHPNDIETIVEAAEILRDREEIHFIFLGSGIKRKWLVDRVAERRMTAITVLEPRPRSEQLDFLNACDIALVSLVGKMWGVSMPSRTYNALAAGKPILALTEPDSEVDRVIKEDSIGWSLPPGDPAKLAAMIIEILDCRGDLAAMAKRAREAATVKYSLDLALKKYRVVMESPSNQAFIQSVNA